MSGVEKRIAGLLVVERGIVRTRDRFSVSWPGSISARARFAGRPEGFAGRRFRKGSDCTQCLDIAIIGAARQGLHSARSSAKKLVVLLVDKRPFCDAARSFSAGKCCGGLLAPDAPKNGSPSLDWDCPGMSWKDLSFSWSGQSTFSRGSSGIINALCEHGSPGIRFLAAVNGSAERRNEDKFPFPILSIRRYFFQLKFLQADRTLRGEGKNSGRSGRSIFSGPSADDTPGGHFQGNILPYRNGWRAAAAYLTSHPY